MERKTDHFDNWTLRDSFQLLSLASIGRFALFTIFTAHCFHFFRRLIIIISNVVPFSMWIPQQRFSLSQINLILLVNSIAAIARYHEKVIKKPFGLKPTKSPKTIIDQFHNLAPEDVEFLKQVDKQFKVHGDKIKIKVERENATAIANRNTKRTIEGSLG